MSTEKGVAQWLHSVGVDMDMQVGYVFDDMTVTTRKTMNSISLNEGNSLTTIPCRQHLSPADTQSLMLNVICTLLLVSLRSLVVVEQLFTLP